MPILLSPELMRQVIMDHYEHPRHKVDPINENEYLKIHMDSTNCVDDINIFLKVENDKIVDCLFNGIACTISTSSTDIMCDLVIGKSLKEAQYIIEQYKNMIYEKEFDETVLDEAVVFINTSKQAARIKCATIGWNGLDELIKK